MRDGGGAGGQWRRVLEQFRAKGGETKSRDVFGGSKHWVDRRSRSLGVIAGGGSGDGQGGGIGEGQVGGTVESRAISCGRPWGDSCRRAGRRGSATLR